MEFKGNNLRGSSSQQRGWTREKKKEGNQGREGGTLDWRKLAGLSVPAPSRRRLWESDHLDEVRQVAKAHLGSNFPLEKELRYFMTPLGSSD